LLELDPKVTAECLTQIEWDLLMRISHRELLHKRFANSEDAPHIHVCKDFFNHVSRWMVLQVVLADGGPKKRGEVIAALIRVALIFRELHNFSGVLQIVSALNHCSVSRLKKTWATLPNKLSQAFESLVELVSPLNNYASYRETIQNTTFPMLPLQAVYLKDLTFIEEQPNKTPNNPDLLNTNKFFCLAAVVNNLVDLQQSTPYELHVDSHLRHFFNTLEVSDEFTDEVLYAKSRAQEQPSNDTPTKPRHGAIARRMKRKGEKKRSSSLGHISSTSSSSDRIAEIAPTRIVQPNGEVWLEFVIEVQPTRNLKTLGFYSHSETVQMSKDATGSALINQLLSQICEPLSPPKQVLLRREVAGWQLFSGKHAIHMAKSLDEKNVTGLLRFAKNQEALSQSGSSLASSRANKLGSAPVTDAFADELAIAEMKYQVKQVTDELATLKVRAERAEITHREESAQLREQVAQLHTLVAALLADRGLSADELLASVPVPATSCSPARITASAASSTSATPAAKTTATDKVIHPGEEDASASTAD